MGPVGDALRAAAEFRRADAGTAPDRGKGVQSLRARAAARLGRLYLSRLVEEADQAASAPRTGVGRAARGLFPRLLDQHLRAAHRQAGGRGAGTHRAARRNPAANLLRAARPIQRRFQGGAALCPHEYRLFDRLCPARDSDCRHVGKLYDGHQGRLPARARPGRRRCPAGRGEYLRFHGISVEAARRGPPAHRFSAHRAGITLSRPLPVEGARHGPSGAGRAGPDPRPALLGDRRRLLRHCRDVWVQGGEARHL